MSSGSRLSPTADRLQLRTNTIDVSPKMAAVQLTQLAQLARSEVKKKNTLHRL